MVKAIDLIRELDLDDIRQQISEKETELEALIAERRKEIDALRILEKAADVAVNGKPARVPRQAKAKSRPSTNGEYIQDDEANRLKISDFLMQTAQQRASLSEISEGIGIPPTAVKRLLDHEWFMKKGAGRGTVYCNANVQG